MRIAYIINSVEGGGAAFPVPAVAAALRSHGVDVEICADAPRWPAIPAMADAGFSVRIFGMVVKPIIGPLRWLRPMLGQYKPDAVWDIPDAGDLARSGGRRGPKDTSDQLAACRLSARRQPQVAAPEAQPICPVVGKTAARSPISHAKLWAFQRTVSSFGRYSRPTRMRPSPHHGRARNSWRFGTLGRLHPVKGYNVLLAAIKILRQRNPAPRAFQLTIGGTGAEHGTLQAQILDAELDDVTLAGFVGDPTAFLANQHLYVQPSRSEGFCIAAHQAMQAGLPVIGSAVGEMSRSIVDGVTGRLAIPGNPVSLASAIFESLEHAADLHRMGFSARRRLFEHYSRDRFNQIAGEILRRLDDLSRQVR